MHNGGDHIRSAEHDTALAFVYEPTEADYQAAVRRCSYGTWPGRGGLLVPPDLILLLVLFFAELRGFAPAVTALMIGCGAIAGVVVARNNLMRDAREQHADMEEYGTCRTVVDDEGMTTTGGPLTSTIDWQAVPWYVETGELFVLTTRRTRIFLRTAQARSPGSGGRGPAARRPRPEPAPVVGPGSGLTRNCGA